MRAARTERALAAYRVSGKTSDTTEEPSELTLVVIAANATAAISAYLVAANQLQALHARPDIYEVDGISSVQVVIERGSVVVASLEPTQFH